MARLADPQVGLPARQQLFRLIARRVYQTQTNVTLGHSASQPLQQRSGSKGIVDQGHVLRGAVRHRPGKRFKRFHLAHQQVRLPLQLLTFRRQAQASPFAQEQRIPQTIFEELN